MPADLVGAHYPEQDVFDSLFGLYRNVLQPNIPAYTNARYLGIASLADTAAALVTTKNVGVPIPVDPGVTISKITVLAGATAEATGSHLNASLYSGIATPANLGQSADNTGAAAVGASAAFTFTLATPVLITTAMAPSGFIYASIGITATTVPSLAAVSVAAAVAYQWALAGAGTGPLGLAFNWGTGGATAPATISSITAQAAAPLVFLT